MCVCVAVSNQYQNPLSGQKYADTWLSHLSLLDVPHHYIGINMEFSKPWKTASDFTPPHFMYIPAGSVLLTPSPNPDSSIRLHHSREPLQSPILALHSTTHGDLRLVWSCSALETRFTKLLVHNSCAVVASRGNNINPTLRSTFADYRRK